MPLGLFPEWTWIVGFFVGAAIGSFLNVVIYRMPRAMSLGNPRHSFCPKCKHQLHTADLIPLFSWLFSRGRCRYCGNKISSRYFFVEVLNGAIWAGIWYQYLCVEAHPGKAIAYALAAALLVAIIFIDLELYMIPDQINALLAVVGIGYNIFLYIRHDPAATTWGMPSSLAGWIVGVATLWGIAFFGRILFRKDAMGHGDIKMARGIGAVLFPIAALISFGLAVALGAVIGSLVLILFRKKGTEAAGTSSDDKKEPESPSAESIQGQEPEGEEDYEPESIGSLLKCGVGYFFGIDMIGLLIPSLYKKWFNDDPFAPAEEQEDIKIEPTMIPFGPYLALGAIIAAVFSPQLIDLVEKYLNSMSGTA